MELQLIEYGLPALFVLSFLAATVLPIASEWLLIALVAQHGSPAILVGVATIGNTLGAITTWAFGLWGGDYVIQRWLRVDSKARQRARKWYARWGSWSLLLAWAPIVGDPLCLVGGMLRVPLWRFIFLVASGKAGRYALVAWAAYAMTV